MKTYDPDKSDTEVRQASPRRMNARVLVTSIIYLIYTLTQANPT